MKLNSNFLQRVVVEVSGLNWVDSPVTGIQRQSIERDGEEVARATSIVRYAPGSAFENHKHELGEEILLLDGVFSDESGSFGSGTYIKNPPGSSHTPSSTTGCTLFVKLRHLDLADSHRTVIDSHKATWFPGLVPGLSVLPLSEFGAQHTALVRWAPGTQFNSHRHYGGEEIYVLEGVFEDEFGRYPAGTWMRSPHLSAHRPFSNEGCTILVKTGHLPVAEPSEALA
ncbi:cupin domain-containing protein [Solimicrobium silvestre]|uniref:Transcriptional activator n=1 Tax=Solimicrobium silvestre TaxID=2099400 RepID=A0A2S9GVI3_9BURK|nr:cupin domain-containing protein [Solimicrobium silvestre]PRC91732.1 Transcriptional activator [Solimicrobium silvestre]